MLNLPSHFRIALAAGVVAILWMAYLTLNGLLSPGIQPGFADKDFANYWTAGRLILSRQTADLFGPQPGYFRHLTDAFGPHYPWHNWSYPPHYLFFVTPLGLVGYKVAMVLFLGATCCFYLWAVSRFAGPRNYLVWVAVLPFLAHNLWMAQNGYLFAGCGLAALALRDTRPVLAGVFLGVLTIKPQLGILFPFLLLAERRWLAIASATITTVFLIAASAVVFGIESWRGYLQEVVPYQTFVMRALDGTFLWMLPSLYGTLRNWGFDAGIALPVHLLFAAPLFFATVAAFMLCRRAEDRSILLLLATFLVTPYALTYDLGLAVPAIGLLAARLDSGDTNRGLVLTVAMLLPVIMMPLGKMHLTIAPVFILAAYAMAFRHSDVITRMRASFGPLFGRR
jgi:arabinofuranan 3-O-arabinosyltransferase